LGDREQVSSSRRAQDSIKTLTEQGGKEDTEVGGHQAYLMKENDEKLNQTGEEN